MDKEISIYDAAWLYFLYYIYENNMKIDSWKSDKRMKGTTCDQSLSKFDFVIKENGSYKITDLEHAYNILEKYFGVKSFKEALIKQDTLKEYDSKDRYYGYPISKIPYDIYMRKHPSLQKDFDRIHNRFVNHYNSQTCSSRILDELIKSKNIKYFNLEEIYKAFGSFPETLKLYRGIKYKYDPSKNEKGYSCWTYKKGQAERFAKHIFTGSIQFEPIYSDDPYILETEVNYKDIAAFIGGEEGEVVLKNPVNIINVFRLD